MASLQEDKAKNEETKRTIASQLWLARLHFQPAIVSTAHKQESEQRESASGDRFHRNTQSRPSLDPKRPPAHGPGEHAIAYPDGS